MYFIMTTLAKIGYGDLFPISVEEKIATIVIMLIGMVFFSYVLEKFVNIVIKDPFPEAVL